MPPPGPFCWGQGPAPQPRRCRDDPAEAIGPQRQGGDESCGERQGRKNALHGRQCDGADIDASLLERLGQERQRDEHDGCRIQCAQNRGGQPDDARQPDVGNEHTGGGEKARESRVGDAGEQGVEILPHAGDEPHTSVEAGDEEDGR